MTPNVPPSLQSVIMFVCFFMHVKVDLLFPSSICGGRLRHVYGAVLCQLFCVCFYVFFFLEGRGDIQPQLDSAMQDVSDKYILLEETEKQALRKALIEHRQRICCFVAMLRPVVVSKVTKNEQRLPYCFMSNKER